MKRKMVQAVLEMSEYNRFSKGIFGWVGFRTKWLQYDNIERSAGKTKWSMWKLFKYSVEGITGFSVAPLSLAGRSGIRLAVTCLYYFPGQRSTASLYRNCRGVSVKDLS